MNKFSIILCDPPWQYRDRLKIQGKHGAIRGAASYYDVLSLEEIKTLPVNNIAAKDCFLFLWVTMPMLPAGLEVIKAWGFKFKTCAFTWIKTTSKGKIHFGMGHYTRGNAELCLLAIKGKPKIINKSVSQITISEIQAHSKKPDTIRERIVRLCGNLHRVELFSRERHPGWVSVGKDINGEDIRESLKKLLEV